MTGGIYEEDSVHYIDERQWNYLQCHEACQCIRKKKGNEASVFMLGKGVRYEKSSTEQFNVIDQVNQFEGDFYVWGVCMKSHGLEGSSPCPIAWMDDLYELSMEADKVFTF